ncbi:MAG: hypothetical protein ACO2PP_09095 [Thermocrinis sp.]|jgi:hypothetical protein|uniref:hypothetical protein n=1 Tax=Thermocrinis sp. TaxID=2024383 RepID=UPI003BFD318B
MAVSPEDLAAGALALQTFIKNAKYVEMVVGVAFGVIPSILGLGAAGLLASGISNTAKEVRSSISLLKTVGPGLLYGTAMAGKGLGKGLRIGLDKAAERWPFFTRIPVIGPVLFKPPKKKGGENQDTQGKQEEQGSGGGGSGGSPPTPPEIKEDKKEEQAKINGMPIDEYIKKKQKA